MHQRLRLVEHPDEQVAPAADRAKRAEPKPEERSRHFGVASAAAGAVIMLMEWKHAGHIIMEPFTAAGTLHEAWTSLWALNDGEFTGWLIWVGVLGGTVGATVKATLTAVKDKLRGEA